MTHYIYKNDGYKKIWGYLKFDINTQTNDRTYDKWYRTSLQDKLKIKEWSSYVTMHTLSSVPSTSDTPQKGSPSLTRLKLTRLKSQNQSHKNGLAVILNTEQHLTTIYEFPKNIQPIYLKCSPLCNLMVWFLFCCFIKTGSGWEVT